MKLLLIGSLLVSAIVGIKASALEDLAIRTLVPAEEASAINRPISHQNIPTPVKTSNSPLSLSAKGVYAIDLATAKPLYEKNSRTKLPIASITKLATVMTLLESHSLNETVTVKNLGAYKPEEAQLGLSNGQQFKLESLLKATLIKSANDAADALANYDSGTKAEFFGKMNNLAPTWGIEGTNFTSASGLEEQDNYASAQALVRFAKIALANSDLKQIVKTKSTSVSDLTGNSYELSSTNQLLGNGKVFGIKTGYTPNAGECLLALANIEGREVVIAILGSQDRFGETAALINWIESNYQWQ